MKKWMNGLLALGLAVMMVLGNTIPAYAAEITPYAEQTSRVQLTLNFHSNTASCHVNVICKPGQTGIFGAAALYDETDKETVASWGISSDSARYTGTKEISVKSGHKYTLSFNGTVGTASGKREHVSGTVTKKN